MLPVAGAGQEHREQFLAALIPESARVAGQQPPVAALHAPIPTHRAPRAGFSRVSAAAALDCSRAASTASRALPAGVSR